MPGSAPRAAATGATGGTSAGFWTARRRAEGDQDLRNVPSDPVRREVAGRQAPLPGQPTVGVALAGEPELGGGGHHEPRPAVGLLGVGVPGANAVALVRVALFNGRWDDLSAVA